MASVGQKVYTPGVAVSEGNGLQKISLKSPHGRTGSRKHELKSKQKLEKKLSFYTKVKDTVTSLNAKTAISKKKKQRSRQKKLKAYDFSALFEFLPETGASQQQTEVKLNCKSKQGLVQPESAQLNAVLNNPQFQLGPFAAIYQHLVSTQPPSSVEDDDSTKHGKKSRKDKKRKKKNNASSTTQSNGYLTPRSYLKKCTRLFSDPGLEPTLCHV